MNLHGFWAGLSVGLLGASALGGVAHPVIGGGAAPRDTLTASARIALRQALPPMEGTRLQVTQVEVTYPPGVTSQPHSHPCPVIGYVVSGSIRSQVRGSAEVTYRAGETFFEPPNGVHQVSGNASTTAPATLLATFVCDTTLPLSTEVPDSGTASGRAP